MLRRRTGIRLLRGGLLALVAIAALPAVANDRVLTVTDFDTLRVNGPYTVEVLTGRGPSGRISGSARAVDSVQVSMVGKSLSVRPSPNFFGGYPGDDPGPVRIRLTTPVLTNVGALGAPTVTVDRMAGQHVRAANEGSGVLTVGAIDADRLDAGLAGAGVLRLAGRAATATLNAQGSGTLDADKLTVADAVLNVTGSGTAGLTAIRTAKVTAAGAAQVHVLGTPSCTLKNAGAAQIACGRPRRP